MKPILFNTEMVRAILEARKTVTRRVVKPQPCDGRGSVQFKSWFHPDWYTTLARFEDDVSAALCDSKPPYQSGDILWVRETCCRWYLPHGEWKYRYKATDPNGNMTPTGPEYDDELEVTPWRPSIHMPKEAARLFLRVTGVRVERLRDIECIATEGVTMVSMHNKRDPRYYFAKLWDSTIKPADLPRYGWEANPWVWVIEFERISKEAAQREEGQDA